ncbi:hypothetical protein AAGS40_28320 (plasmid) [Paraburkholderia sp. PREW-6R]|uniref:hypothetical protein n=1 Tax=Paraburkholderia sp. PREW-6R TaxID=3141544 RepID=UPI0031F539F1
MRYAATIVNVRFPKSRLSLGVGLGQSRWAVYGQSRSFDSPTEITDNRRVEAGSRDTKTPMPNNLERAAYWVTFILEHCPFPNRDALAAQFANAQIVRLCECGCNSFSLSLATPDEVPPIAIASSGQPYRMVFEADFHDRSELEVGGSIEILLFADESGHLADVEIDYCGNGIPIPENLDLEFPPYNVFVSDSLT